MERQVTVPFNRTLLTAVAAAAIGTFVGYALAIAQAMKHVDVWHSARCVCAVRSTEL